MQSHFDGDHLLDEVLLRLDDADRSQVPTGWRTRRPARALDRAPGPLSSRLRRLAAARRPSPHRGRAPADIDRPPAPGGPSLVPDPEQHRRGRGAVQRGRAGPARARRRRGRADAHRGVIDRGLLELINVDTGRPVVQRVVRAEEVLERSEGDAFPDLFVEWDRTAPDRVRVVAARSAPSYAPYDALAHRRPPRPRPAARRRTGHRAGPAAAAMDLTEVAPTLSAAIGEELDDVDGSPRRGPRADSATTGPSPAQGPGSRRRAGSAAAPSTSTRDRGAGSPRARWSSRTWRWRSDRRRRTPRRRRSSARRRTCGRPRAARADGAASGPRCAGSRRSRSRKTVSSP